MGCCGQTVRPKPRLWQPLRHQPNCSTGALRGAAVIQLGEISPWCSAPSKSRECERGKPRVDIELPVLLLEVSSNINFEVFEPSNTLTSPYPCEIYWCLRWLSPRFPGVEAASTAGIEQHAGLHKFCHGNNWLCPRCCTWVWMATWCSRGLVVFAILQYVNRPFQPKTEEPTLLSVWLLTLHCSIQRCSSYIRCALGMSEWSPDREINNLLSQ